MFQKRDRLLLMAERGRFLATIRPEPGAPEEAIEGVLLEWDEAYLIFGDAYQIAATGDRLRIDNELWLPRDNVKYLQRIQHRAT